MCVILLGCIQIWHFYRTLFRGLLFFRTHCILLNCRAVHWIYNWCASLGGSRMLLNSTSEWQIQFTGCYELYITWHWHQTESHGTYIFSPLFSVLAPKSSFTLCNLGQHGRFYCTFVRLCVSCFRSSINNNINKLLLQTNFGQNLKYFRYYVVIICVTAK